MSPSLIQVAREVRTLPKVEIELSGDAACRSMYESFTSRHARLPFVQRKRWGLALLRLPGTFDDYLSPPNRSRLRQRIRRADKRGYRFGDFEALSRLPEILSINMSAPARQGRPMDDAYRDARVFQDSLARSPRLSGVFDSANELVAYAEVPVCGQLFLLARILGHAARLEDGVVYLLVAEIVRRMIDARNASGHPNWGMYDTMVGAGPGLRFFKERAGFEPFNVRWIWQETPGEGRQ